MICRNCKFDIPDKLLARFLVNNPKENFKCIDCRHEIEISVIAKYLGRKGGKTKSGSKAQSSRINGRKGGRPRKYRKT